jgi:hypothetical protein
MIRRMRCFLGILIAVFGLAVCAMPVSALLWASHHDTMGLSSRGTWALGGMLALGLVCLTLAWWLLRGRWSS